MDREVKGEGGEKGKKLMRVRVKEGRNDGWSNKTELLRPGYSY